MATVEEIVSRAGGIAARRVLRLVGASDRTLASAVASGSLRRVRTGWYASVDAPGDVVEAIRVGGALTCVSALRHLGVWAMPDERVHVRVARGVSVTRTSRVVVHWSNVRQGVHFPLVSAHEAVACAVQCLGRRDAVVVVDSMLNLGLITETDAVEICGRSSPGRAVLRLIDGKSESGLETLARLALRRWRVRVRSQVLIPHVGRVDLLIGDRLILELDGQAWHDRPGDFENDRRRDRELVVRGFLVMRVSYRQMMTEWPQIEAQILSLVRRNAHLGRRGVGNSD